MKYVSRFALYWIISLVSIVILYYLFPGQRNLLVKEDSFIENLSALFYFSAFVYGGVLYLKKRKEFSKFLLMISGLGLLGFLDELSFGERLFYIPVPYLYGVGLDASHDFFALFYEILRRLFINNLLMFLLFLSIVLFVVIFMSIKYKDRLKKTYSVVLNSPHYILFIMFLGLLSVALIIDLGLIQHWLLFAIEELFEMNAAIALIICELSLPPRIKLNRVKTL